MRKFLVANIKGGCGKTTIATHLAAAFAAAGLTTVLADADRQQSGLGWIHRRPETAPAVVGLDWSKEEIPAPRGVQRLVIDAPAALKTKRVEELVGMVDVVVVPVLPSAFDEDATERFLKKLEEMKRIARHRTEVAVVGNRLRPRTKASDRLDGFLDGLGHKVVARLRDSQFYPEAAATGLTLFDLPGRRAAEVRADWDPLLAFLEERAKVPA